MRGLTLKNIAKACAGEYIGCEEAKNQEVTSVETDSRKIKQHSLFIALLGEKVDGHDFVTQVFEQGAACVISEKKLELPPDQPYIYVNSTYQALKDIAKYYRSILNIKVVGITGSVGKTSTKEMIASVLGKHYQVLKTQGNFNNEVGLPLTVLNIRDEHEVAVLEMGISDFGEMHRLSEIAKPDICVITNIGQCHLENLKTKQGILDAKSEIFDFISEEGSVCLNGDDPLLRTIQSVKQIQPVFFGLSDHNDVFATDILNKGLLGTQCTIHAAGETFEVQIPIPGEHMVDNALAATAVGIELSLSIQEIKEGIESVEAISGRSHLIFSPNCLMIDDCYNANPVSMKAAIDLLCLATTRKVAFLGDMFELGANEVKLHKEIGKYAASKEMDLLIFVGKLAVYMEEAAQQHCYETQNTKTKCLHFKTKEEAEDQLQYLLKKNDTILVKASHGMHFEETIQLVKTLDLQ
ncbi:MAG: UDP-N-acetylmuramoyl-tripeptide--D-alanyl-D-alanine ligase [Clostridia bacterium]|nr:UDP-N-acetylmuramoyl-tripeptide--D-alanyl-D-alanine ligase [Clostridia bacterium]